MHWHGCKQGSGGRNKAHLPPLLFLQRLVQLPTEGSKTGTRSPYRPWQAGLVGAGSDCLQQQGHLLAVPRPLPSSRADERLGHAGHVGSNSDGVSVIISQGDFTGSPWLLKSGHEHPLLQRPQLVNVP